jgi:hypothetical protein
MRRLVFRMLDSCMFLRSWLHVLWLLVLLLMYHRSLLRLLCLLLVVQVLVFIVITVGDMDMWRPFATERRKLRRLRLGILHRVLVVSSSRGSERSSVGSETQELLMILHHLMASTSGRAVGSVTQSSALIGSITTYQSSTLGPPSAPSSGTFPWYLNSGAFFI